MKFFPLLLDLSSVSHVLSKIAIILPFMVLLWAALYLVLWILGKLDERLNKKLKVMQRSGWAEPAQLDGPIIVTLPVRTRWLSLVLFVGGTFLLLWLLDAQSRSLKEELVRLFAVFTVLFFLFTSVWSFNGSFNRFKLEGKMLEKFSLLRREPICFSISKLESVKPYLNDLAMGADLSFSCGKKVKLRGNMLGYRSMLEAIALQNKEMADFIAAKRASEEPNENARTSRS